MKMLLVSNGNLVNTMKTSLHHYFPQADVESFCFENPAYHQTTEELSRYILDTLSCNINEEFLILSDVFGSTAYNETWLLLERSQISLKSALFTDMSLATVIKFYGMKDTYSLSYFQEISHALPLKNTAIRNVRGPIRIDEHH